MLKIGIVINLRVIFLSLVIVSTLITSVSIFTGVAVASGSVSNDYSGGMDIQSLLPYWYSGLATSK